MGCSRQEDWSGLPFPSPGGLPNPGIEPASPALQADSLPPELPGKPQVLKSVVNWLVGWLVWWLAEPLGTSYASMHTYTHLPGTPWLKAASHSGGDLKAGQWWWEVPPPLLPWGSWA